MRPKLVALLEKAEVELEGDEDEKDKKKKGKDGGKDKKGGGGGGKKGKEEKINAKTQIKFKIDNVMRIMRGESAKDKGKKAGAGDAATGWLDALEPGRNLVVDAPWDGSSSRSSSGVEAAAAATAHAHPARTRMHDD